LDFPQRFLKATKRDKKEILKRIAAIDNLSFLKKGGIKA